MVVLFGEDGNRPSCMGGRLEPSGEVDRPTTPPKDKGIGKLVRVGSKLYGKNTHTERKFNVGLHVEKAPGGIAFRTQNEFVVDKQREYRLLEGRLPTYPGEPPSLATVVEEEEGSNNNEEVRSVDLK